MCKKDIGPSEIIGNPSLSLSSFFPNNVIGLLSRAVPLQRAFHSSQFLLFIVLTLFPRVFPRSRASCALLSIVIISLVSLSFFVHVDLFLVLLLQLLSRAFVLVCTFDRLFFISFYLYAFFVSAFVRLSNPNSFPCVPYLVVLQGNGFSAFGVIRPCMSSSLFAFHLYMFLWSNCHWCQGKGCLFLSSIGPS